MSLVIVNNLRLAYGAKRLFDGDTFSISPSDRIGLAGANGTGKSTLLKILGGQVTPDDGQLVFRRGSRLGYLPQDLAELPSGSVVDGVLASVPGRSTLEARLAETQAQLEVATDEAEQLELAQSFADLHEEVELFDEHYGRHRAERILLGLGFKAAEFAKDASLLSGGWRMRAALAGLLLQDPDLLLLDEPTNHLDLPTLAWFDAFLKRSRKALVLISHDRDFLNRHISRVLSLELEGLRSWVGNYDDYQRLRVEEAERLLKQAERQAAKRAQLQLFVDRFRAKASKAKQAQSKMKQLERMDTIDVREERDTVSIRFPPAPSCGREVARFEGIAKRFGDLVVYDGLNAQLMKGQRVAVVGLNGAGKTTLLKILAGELEPDEGQVVLGHNVIMGYYAQHHGDALERTDTILESLQKVVPTKPHGWVRSVAGAFLFSGDDVEKRVAVLSGGERARVALAKLLLVPANLLVMDEPTNHLDLDSAESLIEALQDYDGTLVFVSHNRSFLNALATHVWDVRDRKIVPFPGNLDAYLHHLELQAADREQGVEAAPEAADAPRADKARRREAAEARQERSKRLKPLKKEFEAIEAEIAKLEAAQKEREAQLSDPAFAADFAQSRPVLDGHRDASERLEKLLARWETLGAELAALEAT